MFTILSLLAILNGCGGGTDINNTQAEMPRETPAAVETSAETAATPEIPDLQTELTDSRFAATDSQLGNFDFGNYTYPLPRGWQNPDGSDATLVNGRLEPVAVTVNEDMSDAEKAAGRASRRIGLSHVITKYFDITIDGQDEAFVILKIETTGNAIPQIVYVYEWKNDKPELIWFFRTGDRADGGLKDIHPARSLLVVELFGQDRFLLGEVETGKITGDEEQLCCPTHFTRTFYKWNGNHFVRQGNRLTFVTADPIATPQENLGDKVNAAEKSRKFR